MPKVWTDCVADIWRRWEGGVLAEVRREVREGGRSKSRLRQEVSDRSLGSPCREKATYLDYTGEKRRAGERGRDARRGRSARRFSRIKRRTLLLPDLQTGSIPPSCTLHNVPPLPRPSRRLPVPLQPPSRKLELRLDAVLVSRLSMDSAGAGLTVWRE